MDAKKVIETIFKYLEKNMVPGMNGLQEIAFYAVKEAIDDEADNLVDTIKAKPLVRAIAAIDKDGNVDVEKLAGRVRNGIAAKGSLTIDIPLYGSICFTPNDIDNILADLKEVDRVETYQNLGRAY
jgi:hypothetical protein